MRRLHLIVNPAAGGVDAELVRRVAQRLRSGGQPVRTSRSRSPRAAGDLIADTAARGERAVLVGGDGLLHSVVGHLVAAGVECALIPAGRGNDFARQLGIPCDPDAAADLAAAGTARAVDVLRIDAAQNVAYAAGSVYAGIDSRVSELVNGYRRIPRGIQYPFGAVQAILTFSPRVFRVTVDDAVHSYVGVAAIAANSGFYGNGMHIAPGARPDDGLIDVVLLGAPNRTRFLRLLPTVYRGTHVAQPEVTILRGTRVEIACAGVPAYADGEPLAELPVAVEVVPGALSVVC